jgi:signal transduction histidine kinase
MKLRNKILLLFLLIAQMPVLLTGYLAYRINREALEQETISYLVATNLQKSARINHWIDDAAKDLEYLANIPFIQEKLMNEIDKHDTLDQEHQQYHKDVIHHYLQPMMKKGDLIELFVLRPADGVILLSTDSLQEEKFKENRPYFIEGQKNTYIQNVFYSMSLQQPGMVISTPINDAGGRPVAVLAGRLNMKALSSIMEERSDLKTTEDTYLVNPQNYFITEPRYGKEYALRKTVYTKGVQNALHGQDGTALYPDYRGIPVIGAYLYLPERNIALITEIDQKEYLAPIKRLQRTTLGIGALMAVLSLLAGWICADALLQPLLHLVAAVNKMSADNLVFINTISGKHEIAQLAKAFAGMAGRLQESLVSRDELQQEIEVRRKTEEELKNTLVQLNRSNKELEQFAYVASHDLQEPLRMVSSYVQLLAERYKDQLDEKAQKFIYYAVDGAVRMQMLIQDLLEFSRVSTKGLAIIRIDSNILLAEALANLQTSITASGAEITHDQLPMVVGDRTQIVQVFQNLIANSIKFCTNKPPRVHVSAETSNEHWTFSVRDNGIGIDAKYAEKIFIIFQRLHTREEYPGTGIGLALCKRIVERHGGEIRFESEVDKGSTFSFSLLNQEAEVKL